MLQSFIFCSALQWLVYFLFGDVNRIKNKKLYSNSYFQYDKFLYTAFIYHVFHVVAAGVYTYE